MYAHRPRRGISFALNHSATIPERRSQVPFSTPPSSAYIKRSLFPSALSQSLRGRSTLALQVNAGELGRRGHKLNFVVAETYGDEEKSILVTADLWTRNVSGYIGPQETCVHEGRMAAAFNLPMISYVSYFTFFKYIGFAFFARD